MGVEGNSAYVVYANADGSQRVKPIEEEGGAWKLSSLPVQFIEQTPQ
jgi:hypothetical protein